MEYSSGKEIRLKINKIKISKIIERGRGRSA